MSQSRNDCTIANALPRSLAKEYPPFLCTYMSMFCVVIKGPMELFLLVTPWPDQVFGFYSMCVIAQAGHMLVASPASKGSATPEVCIIEVWSRHLQRYVAYNFFLNLTANESVNWTTGIDSLTELFCTKHSPTRFSIKAA